MTKKVDTDPNFPPPSEPKPDLDALLDGLAKQQFQLKPTAKQANSGGEDAVEYQAEPRLPPARVDHNTFPNAPVIVDQTDPGAPPQSDAPDPLNVTPEERKRLERMFEEKRKDRERAAPKQPEVEAQERQADTAPRQHDAHPPGVVTDPPKQSKRGTKLGLVLLGVVTLAVIWFVATRTGTSTKNTSTSASAPSNAATSVKSATAATATVNPTIEETTTASAVPTAIVTSHPHGIPTTTATSVATATARPTATVPPNTTGTATPRPTTTTSATAVPSIFTGNE